MIGIIIYAYISNRHIHSNQVIIEIIGYEKGKDKVNERDEMNKHDKLIKIKIKNIKKIIEIIKMNNNNYNVSVICP